MSDFFVLPPEDRKTNRIASMILFGCELLELDEAEDARLREFLRGAIQPDERQP